MKRLSALLSLLIIIMVVALGLGLAPVGVIVGGLIPGLIAFTLLTFLVESAGFRRSIVAILAPVAAAAIVIAVFLFGYVLPRLLVTAEYRRVVAPILLFTTVIVALAILVSYLSLPAHRKRIRTSLFSAAGVFRTLLTPLLVGFCSGMIGLSLLSGTGFRDYIVGRYVGSVVYEATPSTPIWIVDETLYVSSEARAVSRIFRNSATNATETPNKTLATSAHTQTDPTQQPDPDRLSKYLTDHGWIERPETADVRVFLHHLTVPAHRRNLPLRAVNTINLAATDITLIASSDSLITLRTPDTGLVGTTYPPTTRRYPTLNGDEEELRIDLAQGPPPTSLRVEVFSPFVGRAFMLRVAGFALTPVIAWLSMLAFAYFGSRLSAGLLSRWQSHWGASTLGLDASSGLLPRISNLHRVPGVPGWITVARPRDAFRILVTSPLVTFASLALSIPCCITALYLFAWYMPVANIGTSGTAYGSLVGLVTAWCVIRARVQGNWTSGDGGASVEEDALHEVVVREKADYNVVFIHGLEGHWKQTWHPPDRADLFWPAWLGEDLPTANIYSVHYNVSATKWRGRSIPLFDRAGNILKMLEVTNVFTRPTCFVAHSLGGLVVKQVWRMVLDRKMREPRENIRGAIFVATPHVGSAIPAYLRNVVAQVLLRPAAVVEELASGGRSLMELDEWYSAHHIHFNAVYFETQPLNGVVVVDNIAARLPVTGVYPVPVEGNHLTIVKPSGRSSLLYLGVKADVREAFKADVREAFK
jgi:Putative serine esterase (DUF676)